MTEQRDLWRSALAKQGVHDDQLDDALTVAERIFHAIETRDWDLIETVDGFGDITRGLATVATAAAFAPPIDNEARCVWCWANDCGRVRPCRCTGRAVHCPDAPRARNPLI